MPLCEGCGTRADDMHISRRTVRLELSKRFRPLQIRVLFLDSAPPNRVEDYFYNPARDRADRSIAPRMFFDELSPITQRRASTRLDLPQPFGPTMPVSPGSIRKSVDSAKVLKPAI